MKGHRLLLVSLSPPIFRLCTTPGSRCFLRTEDTEVSSAMSPRNNGVSSSARHKSRVLVLGALCMPRDVRNITISGVFSLRVHQDGSLFALARNHPLFAGHGKRRLALSISRHATLFWYINPLGTLTPLDLPFFSFFFFFLHFATRIHDQVFTQGGSVTRAVFLEF